MDTIKDKFPHLPDRIAGLGELAYNLWWSWHPAARNDYITNGVHVPGWIEPKIKLLFNKYLGPGWLQSQVLSEGLEKRSGLL